MIKLATGRAVRPNAGLREAYAGRLADMVEDMHRSTVYWLTAEYKRQLPRVGRLMAHDASPARTMQDALRAQVRRWRDKLDERADAYADWFARRANAAASAGVKTSLSEAAGFTVKFKLTRNVNNVLQSVIAENVSLIGSIHARYFEEVEGLVMRSVREGRDIAELADELEKRFSMTRQRALLIARDQNNKASASIARARMQDAGVTQGVWRHSGRSRTPRPDHVEADGEVFNLDTGLLIGGRYVFPGHDINCGCTFAPVLPAVAQRQRKAT